jgi:O-methyltransferase involved in polyketide biosynthesis
MRAPNHVYSASVARDFSTISPSARWLLLAKAHSGLPYAREAAELVFGLQDVADAVIAPSAIAARRRKHVELRARSLDEALDLTGESRILELASGFSFRGLARAARPEVHYVDSDLPDVVELKTALLAKLAVTSLAGTYRIEALDALDPEAFLRVVDSLPAGPLAIVHEGLLMYLDAVEKARLASTIRAVLRARGGVWITGDVHVRSEAPVQREAYLQQFFAEHRVEERKFADWADAEAFFTGQGFEIARKLAPASDHALERETWIMTAR